MAKRAPADPKPKPRSPSHRVFGAAVCEAILANIRKGCTQSTAASCVGISPRTLRSWLTQGRRNDAEVTRARAHGDASAELDEYGQFFAAYLQAEGEPRAHVERVLLKHAGDPDGDYRASVAWLERRDPKGWGKVDSTRTVELDDDGEVKDASSLDRIKAKLAEQAERMRAIDDDGG